MREHSSTGPSYQRIARLLYAKQFENEKYASISGKKILKLYLRRWVLYYDGYAEYWLQLNDEEMYSQDQNELLADEYGRMLLRQEEIREHQFRMARMD